jgi:hypothetical protein
VVYVGPEFRRHKAIPHESLRSMNIHRASLFPGLNGFCQSLKLDLEIKVANEAIRTAAVDRTLDDVSGKI